MTARALFIALGCIRQTCAPSEEKPGRTSDVHVAPAFFNQNGLRSCVALKRQLISVKNLTKYFPLRKGAFRKPKEFLRAVDGVSLWIDEGETVGLVGESGCGKSTLARCLLRLIEPTSGEVMFDDVEITKLSYGDLRKLRSKLQIVFQNPYASLDPRMTIKDIVAEPLRIHKMGKRNEIEVRVLELLTKVGLTQDHAYRLPHEFSGGQRQRICIARALALNPKFLVLDEPTSSLDVSVQAQILNLLKELQNKLNLTYLFISHDLSVVKHMSDGIAVMYVGKILEIAPKKDLFEEQIHPYTKALVSAIPAPNPHFVTNTILLEGDPPSSVDLPKGCRFHPRCPVAHSICRQSEPELKDLGKGRFVACHHI